MEWQPIETAPQGTMFLLADMTAKEARHWAFVGWKHQWNKDDHVETPSALNRRATHWQHLPEPPK
jgi:glucose/arabinose dehydrogenase